MINQRYLREGRGRLPRGLAAPDHSRTGRFNPGGSATEDLTGLPPAWIGVGTLDLFHDEDVAYARRLSDSGVPCDLDVVPGAFHGFDFVFPKAEVSREFWRRQARALEGAL
ncbi:alpha/beta hydrolase [Streptomyces sporangiiformans]|uniref:alpha/beta hydrolase n=1 Tax=Streptomyces sporangiiformans TaxID=2315329 RepID=UPI001F08DEDA|nr:alpha/beta hydrolase fold domain-containing protein [Streptomyces sporangiiformans]